MLVGLNMAIQIQISSSIIRIKKSVTRKAPSDFKKWSVTPDVMNNVSYIEVFDDAEILKSINIIDTPGLDAERNKDSQNTLDFLSKVRPDAVIMLFTHSIAESTLKVVEDFNSCGMFSPINAIGIQSKIDISWMEQADDYPSERRSAIEIGKRLTGKKMEREPKIKQSIFNLLPISSLLFLQSHILDEKNIEIIQKLNSVPSEKIDDVFESVSDFNKLAIRFGLNDQECSKLIGSLGLYGVYILTLALRRNPNYTLRDLRELLYKESGAEDFMSLLYNHFGLRTSLIKTESIYARLMRDLNNEKRHNNDNQDQLSALNWIEDRFTELFTPINIEHDQFELLKMIYAGELKITDEERSEILALCGEKGHSAHDRLGLKKDVSIEDMISHVTIRQTYWRRKMALDVISKNKRWKQLLIRIYAKLYNQIREFQLSYLQSQAFLYN